ASTRGAESESWRSIRHPWGSPRVGSVGRHCQNIYILYCQTSVYVSIYYNVRQIATPLSAHCCSRSLFLSPYARTEACNSETFVPAHVPNIYESLSLKRRIACSMSTSGARSWSNSSLRHSSGRQRRRSSAIGTVTVTSGSATKTRMPKVSAVATSTWFNQVSVKASFESVKEYRITTASMPAASSSCSPHAMQSDHTFGSLDQCAAHVSSCSLMRPYASTIVRLLSPSTPSALPASWSAARSCAAASAGSRLTSASATARLLKGCFSNSTQAVRMSGSRLPTLRARFRLLRRCRSRFSSMPTSSSAPLVVTPSDASCLAVTLAPVLMRVTCTKRMPGQPAGGVSLADRCTPWCPIAWVMPRIACAISLPTTATPVCRWAASLSFPAVTLKELASERGREDEAAFVKRLSVSVAAAVPCSRKRRGAGSALSLLPVALLSTVLDVLNVLSVEFERVLGGVEARAAAFAPAVSLAGTLRVPMACSADPKGHSKTAVRQSAGRGILAAGLAVSAFRWGTSTKKPTISPWRVTTATRVESGKISECASVGSAASCALTRVDAGPSLVELPLVST
ncbi:hypothetical protein T492DRAFT_268739, partial [Pavlovales sp. CCMP2436]